MFVYADNAATTKMSKTAIDAMLPYLDTWYGNASSLYEFGQKSAEALAAARETVAKCLGAEAREIPSTSGGSAVGGVVTVVGVAVLASSYVWGISQARDWLSVDSNRRGNPLTVMGRAMDAISDDMSKSPSNFLRDVVSTGTVVALAPLSALLLIL